MLKFILVSPRFQHHGQFWHYIETLVKALKNVQKIFTAKIKGIRNLSYTEILEKLELFFLAQRLKRNPKCFCYH